MEIGGENRETEDEWDKQIPKIHCEKPQNPCSGLSHDVKGGRVGFIEEFDQTICFQISNNGNSRSPGRNHPLLEFGCKRIFIISVESAYEFLSFHEAFNILNAIRMEEAHGWFIYGNNL